ncbi:LysR family transcriptional regulator [Halomonas pacifica]|uniref:LysR family transcriptional regulator n=1 Tax=Bisbaumannia pacifica TaxID=77098 RepID=A0A510X5M1_9GAMM|nr:LysR family transcriptional regulator [Halomonas pacifica]MDC8802066.1 LysR family transcriptional regulator [Halomonas pacifica]GEK46728.1 LysR family transcriptional regulator [Halomonas pacifica]
MILEHLRVFLRIVECGGLAAAGRELGLSPATVSERLATLERHFGARLLHRTTRAISLTEEGRELVEGGRRLLAETEELETRIRFGVERLAGPIRLSAPLDLGRQRISRLLDEVMDAHPEISVELTLHDGYVDLAAQGIDLAVRLGTLTDSSLKARRLADNARILCAAPDYLARHGVPEHPEALRHHDCLCMRFGDTIEASWPFVIDGRTRHLAVRGRRIANDGGLVRDWAVRGLGIARKSEWDIADDLAAGRLVPLLREYEGAPGALQAVYPSGRAPSRRVRYLLDTLVAAFASEPSPADLARHSG